MQFKFFLWRPHLPICHADCQPLDSLDCVNLSNVSNDNAYDQDGFIRVVSIGDVSIRNLSVVNVLIVKLS